MKPAGASERLAWEEIRERYPDEWVRIADIGPRDSS